MRKIQIGSDVTVYRDFISAGAANDVHYFVWHSYVNLRVKFFGSLLTQKTESSAKQIPYGNPLSMMLAATSAIVELRM